MAAVSGASRAAGRRAGGEGEHYTHVNIDPKKCFRNIAIVGGGAVAIDLLIPLSGSWELALQTVVVFIFGLTGLFRRPVG